jgi:hypothetical protein
MTIGFIDAAHTALSVAGKVKAGISTGPDLPLASNAADSPAVALQAVTQVSSSNPKVANSPASSRWLRGPKFEYQRRLCISSNIGM